MHLILLSGGSGKRLWPLSNDIRSKQFLKLLLDEHGNRQSMVQRVYAQIKQAQPNADITIATNTAQVDSIRSQLGDSVDIVLEPERRDTYPAIVLSCSYLALKKGVTLNETIAVLPVDPYTEVGFFRTLSRMDTALDIGADIALMGIAPLLPTSKYGYIVPGKQAAPDILKVSRFVEKPDEQTAAKLIQDGAYWNGGVFACKLGYIMEIAKRSVDFDSYEELLSRYSMLKKTSFDYEVVERAEHIAVVPYRGKWTDIGTWRTLTDEMDTNTLGETAAVDTKNTYVINELDIPVIALGTKDLVIAASPDGILVSDLISSSQLKPLVDTMENRPMYEERRWGEYTVLDVNDYGDNHHSLVKHLFLRSGMSISYQLHRYRDEIWVVTNGAADFVLDDELRTVAAGDILKIKTGQKHAIKATTDLHIVEVQTGSTLVEDDTEKFLWHWKMEDNG